MNSEKKIRLLRLKEVQEMVGLCRTTVLVMVKRGDFPKPIKITARAVAWVEHEVESWIESRQPQLNPEKIGIRKT